LLLVNLLLLDVVHGMVEVELQMQMPFLFSI
jgi:hypothetical protein